MYSYILQPSKKKLPNTYMTEGIHNGKQQCGSMKVDGYFNFKWFLKFLQGMRWSRKGLQPHEYLQIALTAVTSSTLVLTALNRTGIRGCWKYSNWQIKWIFDLLHCRHLEQVSFLGTSWHMCIHWVNLVSCYSLTNSMCVNVCVLPNEVFFLSKYSLFLTPGGLSGAPQNLAQNMQQAIEVFIKQAKSVREIRLVIFQQDMLLHYVNAFKRDTASGHAQDKERMPRGIYICYCCFARVLVS